MVRSIGNILAIDPGAAHPGPACAYFANGRLRDILFSYYPGGAGLDAVVWEVPQFDGRTMKVDIRDVMRLTKCGAMAAGHALGQAGLGIGSSLELTPLEWKGSEPKPTHHARLWDVLAPAERAILGGDETREVIERAIEKGALRRWKIAGADCYPRAWKGHNLLDATALGCFYLGRLEKR